MTISDNLIDVKNQEDVVTILSVRNCCEQIISICYNLLEFSTVLFVIDENSNDGTREKLVEVGKKNQVIIIDSDQLSVKQRQDKLLDVGKNSIEFFPFTFILFLDATSPISDETYKKLLEKFRYLNCPNQNIEDEFSTKKLTCESFYQNFIPKNELGTLYEEKLKAHTKNLSPLKKGLFLQSIFNKIRSLFYRYTSFSSGVFEASYHINNLYLDYPPFKYLSDKYTPASVLDIGCGLGGYIEAFRVWGTADVLGIDGLANNKNIICQNNYLRHDLREPLNLTKSYDLVICVEVAEHIPPENEDILLNNIIQHSQNRILFSAAQIGQPGIGHINCHSTEYWLRKWKILGWEVNVYDSLVVRSLSTFLWFRKNLIVLEKIPKHKQPKFVLNDQKLLHKNMNMNNWFNQSPAVYHQPFGEKQ